MKYQLFIIAFVLIAPFIISAEIVVQNSGSIKSQTTSSASTGGNSVGSGPSTGSGQAGTVVTGDAGASSKSEVTSGGDGTDVHIETSTTVNGETKTQTVEKTLKPGEPISVEVNSKSVSGQKTETSIKINNEELAATGVATVTTETIARTGGEEVKRSFVATVASRVSEVIKNIFSIFKFW